MSGSSPTPVSDRFSALTLGLIVFVCMTMIGGASFLKHKLDRAEAALVSVESVVGSDQDILGRLTKEWGYSGFLGLAQKYVYTRDASDFVTMRERIKAANDIVSQLPESMPSRMRNELTSIGALFETALQKMDAPANSDLLGEFTSADLAPLYAALPVLDTYKSLDIAKGRLTAKDQTQFWGMMLTLTCWLSLVLACGCAVWAYLALKDRRSAPLRALAQSIQNMAHGDMRSAVWGIERQDMIGELARAIDMARYHFSHMPDVSLLSDDGPVRLRFEGGSKSLFESMMKALSTDSEAVRNHAANLSRSISDHEATLDAMIDKVDAVLENIGKRGEHGDKLIAQAIRDMVGSTESLKNAHAHAVDQLGRMLPSIQDRAKNLSEITQITGKQLTQTLQSLASSEISLRANMEQSKTTLSKLSSTADDFGERLFGAINLLQASGKVLGETTDSIKAQWTNLSPAQDWGDRLNQIVEQLGEIQSKIEVQTDAQNGLARTLEGSDAQEASGAGFSLPDMEPLAEQVDEILTILAALRNKFEDHLEKQEATAETSENESENDDTPRAPMPSVDSAQHLAEAMEKVLASLASVQEKLDAAPAARPTDDEGQAPAPVDLSPLTDTMGKISTQLSELQTKLDAHAEAQSDIALALDQANKQLSSPPPAIEFPKPVDMTPLSEALGQVSSQLTDLQTRFEAHMEPQVDIDFAPVTSSLDVISAQINELRLKLDEQNEAHASMTSTLEHSVRQNCATSTAAHESALAPLAEKVASIGEQLLALRATMEHQSAQQPSAEETARLHKNVSEIGARMSELADLNGRVAVFISALPGDLRQALKEELQDLTQKSHADEILDKVAALQKRFEDTPDMAQQLAEIGNLLVARLGEQRSLINGKQQEVTAKLDVLEHAIETTQRAAEMTRDEMTKPKPPVTYTLPPELQQQFLDQWFQMSAQIEASRNSTAAILAEQIKELETRLAAMQPKVATKSTADYALQIQIEKQTEILSELVNTLSLLDAHVQQFKDHLHIA